MEQLGVGGRDGGYNALQAVGLEGFKTRDLATLSGGKAAPAIAATLALQPRIMVFDEPTTDLTRWESWRSSSLRRCGAGGIRWW
jgi:energy-coupling factor transporter ATP-binding protein EcfA2